MFGLGLRIGRRKIVAFDLLLEKLDQIKKKGVE
jgi:hypothetical protein